MVPVPTPTEVPTSAPVPLPSIFPSISSACDDQTFVGDGKCDEEANTLDCNWDGGDCCGWSCVSSTYTCGSEAAYDCQDPAGDNIPSSRPTHSPTYTPTVIPEVKLSQLTTGAIALIILTLLLSGGLIYCFCKSGGSSSSVTRDDPNEKKSCFQSLFSFNSNGPKFTQMRGSRSSGGSMTQDERAVELARFERMSDRSDAYPKNGGQSTSNPINPGDKFRNLGKYNGDALI